MERFYWPLESMDVALAYFGKLDSMVVLRNLCQMSQRPVSGTGINDHQECVVYLRLAKKSLSWRVL